MGISWPQRAHGHWPVSTNGFHRFRSARWELMCCQPGQALFLANAGSSPLDALRTLLGQPFELGSLLRKFGTPRLLLGNPPRPLGMPLSPLSRPARLGRQVGQELAQLARQVRPRIGRRRLETFGE
jgi:hypothetical protein